MDTITHCCHSLSLLLALGALPAQSVAVSAPVATVLTVQTASTPVTSQVGAGALPAVGAAQAVDPGGSRVDLFWAGGASSAACVVDARAICRLTTAGAASVSPGRLLFTVALPAPGAVLLEMTVDIRGTAGAAIPHATIDIGADGQIDLSQAGPFPTLNWAMNVPSGTLPIEIEVGGALAGPGTVDAYARVAVRPSNGVVASSVYPGCSAETFSAWPTWSGDIGYQVLTGFGQATVVVFGLQVQPVMLPAPALLPCILFPTPDSTVLVTTFTPQTLPIPPAARPVTVWAEGVVLDPVGLRTTSTWRLHAN